MAMTIVSGHVYRSVERTSDSFGTFTEAWNEHQGLISVKRAPYPGLYDRYIGRFKGSKITLIEFGVGKGGSLQLWKKFLGQNASIIGVDVNNIDDKLDDGIEIIIGRQEDESLLKTLPDADVIIDDCGHCQEAQKVTFDIMWNKLRCGGVYIVEDLDHHESFIEHATRKMRSWRMPFHMHKSMFVAEKINELDREIRVGK